MLESSAALGQRFWWRGLSDTIYMQKLVNSLYVYIEFGSARPFRRWVGCALPALRRFVAEMPGHA